MPGPSLTESRLWESVTAPPADGDAVSISAGAAPLRANFMQKMAGRDSYLFNGPFNGFLDHVRAEVTASGTDRTWHLRSVRNLAIHRGDGTINRFTDGTGTTSIALTGLSASTWYYVYAYNNAGVLALEVSATLPEPTLDFKDSDTTRVYLGCFVTDTAGRAVPQFQSGRRYTFRPGFAGLSGVPLLLGDSVGFSGFISVSARVPDHVRCALVSYYSITNTTTAARTAGVATTGDGLGLSHFHAWKSGSNSEQQTGLAELVVIGGTIDLYASHPTEVSVIARLVGFTE